MSEHDDDPEPTGRGRRASSPAPARCRSRGSSSPATRSPPATPARDEAMALFLGQDQLPVPPKNAKVHTSACQYCNVGCGYKIYTWPVGKTPQSRRRRPVPKGPLGDWISPAMVTRGKVDGKDSYIAVVPDSDCIVNKGDHSPRGGTNALTVYTKRKHPLTKPDRAPPATRWRATRKGGRAQARQLGRGAQPRRRRDQARARQPRAVLDRPLGRRPPVAGDELRLDQAVLRRASQGPLRPGAGPRPGRRGARDPQPPEVELRAPDHRRPLRLGLDAALLLPRLRARRHRPDLGRQLATRPARSSTTGCTRGSPRRSSSTRARPSRPRTPRTSAASTCSSSRTPTSCCSTR